MIRKITTHPESSIRFTPNCKKITQQLNEYRRANGEVSLKEMARIFGLRERNCAAYYYGTHYFMGGPGNCRSWQQMRRGACVDLWGSLRYLVGGELVTLTLSHYLTPRSAARPPARLAQATLRFSSAVLYHRELPNPGICAIIMAWKQKHFSPLLKPCKIFRILCLTLWHPQRWQLIGSAIALMFLLPMMW